MKNCWIPALLATLAALSARAEPPAADPCAIAGAPVPGVPPAEYQPGVDVQGRAVAPADLPDEGAASGFAAFPVEIPIGRGRRFGVPRGSEAFRPGSIFGYVVIGEGRAFFGGEPLGEDGATPPVPGCGGESR